MKNENQHFQESKYNRREPVFCCIRAYGVIYKVKDCLNVEEEGNKFDRLIQL